MNFFDLAVTKSYLYEGLTVTNAKSIRLWESAGYKLTEAQLTVDQIQQIFQQIEQTANAAPGGNRTMIGKGKDAATAVNRAWEDLKTKIQNSGPVQGFDQKVSDLLNKIGMGSADPQFNGQVSSWVQKYRDFAAKHPIAQGAIYATLIAVTGLSGAGLGGAAALGLLKMADKLLQGERFTSAAYSGAKTGAMAYGASKVGDYIKGAQQQSAVAGEKVLPVQGQSAPAGGGNFSSSNSYSGTLSGVTGDQITSSPVYQQVYADQIRKFGGSSPQAIQAAKQFATVAAKAAILKGQVQESLGVALTPSMVHYVIKKIVAEQELNEGIMDTIKGAAGKAASWAQTKGRNLTTKITADKLLQAWKKADSPTDSLDLASIIQRAGVPSATIKQVYGTMQIPFAGEPGGGASMPPKTNAAPAATTTPTPATKTPTTTTAATTPAVGVASKTPAGWDYASAAKLAGIKSAAPQLGKLPTGYSKINQPTSVNYARMTESLTWSKHFDPGMSVWKRMHESK